MEYVSGNKNVQLHYLDLILQRNSSILMGLVESKKKMHIHVCFGTLAFSWLLNPFLGLYIWAGFHRVNLTTLSP